MTLLEDCKVSLPKIFSYFDLQEALSFSLSLSHTLMHTCNTHTPLTFQSFLFAAASPAAGFPSLPLPLVPVVASGPSTLPPYSSFLIAPPEVEPAHASAAHPTAPGPCGQPGEGMCVCVCVCVWRGAC